MYHKFDVTGIFCLYSTFFRSKHSLTEKTDKIHVKKQVVTFVVVSKGRESREKQSVQCLGLGASDYAMYCTRFWICMNLMRHSDD
jgi:hypothetical protein